MRDWLQALWNRRPVVLLTEHGMLVFGASEDHLKLDAKSVIPAMNTWSDHFIIICFSEYAFLRIIWHNCILHGSW
jgi:hypothetical protein